MLNPQVQKRICNLQKSLATPGHYKNKKVLWMAKEFLARLQAGICSRCGKRPYRENATTCLICKQQQSGYAKGQQRVRRNIGQCRRCSSRATVSEYCQRCHGLRLEAGKKHRELARKELLDHYGRVCACCGLDDIRFLSLDHVNNDGHKHRRDVFGGNRTGNPTYLARWAKRNGWPDWLQILCFNCNLGKARNGGICPHKQAA